VRFLFGNDYATDSEVETHSDNVRKWKTTSFVELTAHRARPCSEIKQKENHSRVLAGEHLQHIEHPDRGDV
jgi:hypothetical protein